MLPVLPLGLTSGLRVGHAEIARVTQPDAETLDPGRRHALWARLDDQARHHSSRLRGAPPLPVTARTVPEGSLGLVARSADRPGWSDV